MALLNDSPIVNITNYFVVLMMDGVPCVLDNKWSRDTIDKLIEHFHIEYVMTAIGKFKRTTSFGTYEKYISEQLKVDDLLHIDLHLALQAYLKLIIVMSLHGLHLMLKMKTHT